MKLKKVGIIESKEGYWELNRILDENGEITEQMKLLYVQSGLQYSDEDVSILTNIDKIKDLLKMLKQIEP